MIPTLQRIDGWLTRHGKVLFLALLIFSAYAGVRYHSYASNRFSEDTARITSLEGQNADLTNQVSNLTAGLGLSNTRSEVLKDTGFKLASSFDSMDALFNENSSNASDLIEWMARTGQFYGDNISIGSQKYGAWQAQQTEAAKKYVEIKNEMQTYFDSVPTLTNPSPNTQS